MLSKSIFDDREDAHLERPFRRGGHGAIPDVKRRRAVLTAYDYAGVLYKLGDDLQIAAPLSVGRRASDALARVFSPRIGGRPFSQTC